MLQGGMYRRPLPALETDRLTESSDLTVSQRPQACWKWDLEELSGDTVIFSKRCPFGEHISGSTDERVAFKTRASCREETKEKDSGTIHSRCPSSRSSPHLTADRASLLKRTQRKASLCHVVSRSIKVTVDKSISENTIGSWALTIHRAI